MNCKNCGNLLSSNDQFCKNCGTAVSQVSVPNINSDVMVSDMSVQNQNVDKMNFNAQTLQSIDQGIGGQVLNPQPDLTNGYSAQQLVSNVPPTKKSEIMKYILFGIFIVLLFFVVFICIIVFGNPDDSTNNNDSNNNLVQSNVTHNVKFKGFTFKIPDNLVYEMGNNVLLIYDELETWIARIELEKGDFSQLQANKGQLHKVLQQNRYTASVAQEKTINGVNFITLEVSRSGENAVLALAKANSMYFIGVTSFSLDNKFDYSLLEKIAPIISSVTYEGSSNYLELDTKIDMSAIAELAK